MRPRLPWHAAAQIAARQHGRITGAQLHACGVGPDAVKHALRRGRLFEEHRGVYALGHPGVSREARWMSAVLACGAAAMLSHRSAAMLLDVARTPFPMPELSVPRPGSARRPGILVHHVGTLAPEDRRLRRGIPVTDLARLLVDLAAVVDRTELDHAFDRAARRGILDLAAVHEVLSRVARPRGARVLRTVLAEHDTCPWTRSQMERRFLRLCRISGVPMPLVNLPLSAGGRTLVADFVWVAERLVVETDGMEFHGTAPAARWDRRRDRALVLDGWRVLRYTWQDFAGQAAETAAELEVALRGTGRLEVQPRR